MINYTLRGIPYNTKTWEQVGTLPDHFDRVRCLCAAGNILYCAAYDYTVPRRFEVFSLDYATKTWTSIYTAEADAYPMYLTEMGGSLYLGLDRVAGIHNVYKLTLPSTWTGLGLPAGAGNLSTNCLISHAGKLYYTTAGTSLDNVYEFQSGTTWASIGTPVPGTALTQIASCGGNLYALARDPAAMGNILVKVWAGGTTWNAVATITPAVAGAGYFVTDGVTLYVAAGGAPGRVYRFTAPSTFTNVGVCPAGVAANRGDVHEGRPYIIYGTHVMILQQQDGSEMPDVATLPAGYTAYIVYHFNGKLWYGQGKTDTAFAGQAFELGLRHQGF